MSHCCRSSSVSFLGNILLSLIYFCHFLMIFNFPIYLVYRGPFDVVSTICGFSLGAPFFFFTVFVIFLSSFILFPLLLSFRIVVVFHILYHSIYFRRFILLTFVIFLSLILSISPRCPFLVSFHVVV